LYAFDGCENGFRGCQGGESIDREGLEDGFEQDEPAGEVKSSEGPGGQSFREGREEKIPRGVFESIIN
jgi:hypothetical protein